MRHRIARVVVVCVALLTLAACQKKLRHVFDTCGSGAECESGSCYHGRCALPCTQDTDCGVQLCLDGVCQDADTPCDDGHVCTTDAWVNGKCKAIGERNCSKWTTECTIGVCDDKIVDGKEPCVANIDPERLDDACLLSTHKAASWACGAGGPNQNGCQCALHQGNVAGPYDDPKGTKNAKDGVDQLHGAAVAGRGVLAVGSTQAAPNAPRLGLVVRIEAAGWTLFSAPLALDAATTQQSLSRVAAAPGGGWLAVGAAGTSAKGWLVRLQGEQHDEATGTWRIQTAWQTAVVPSFAATGELRDVAAAPQAKWLAVGRAASTQGVGKPWLVLANDAGLVLDQKSPALPGGAVSGQLTGVAATPTGFLAVGQVDTASGSKGWLLSLDAAGQVLKHDVRIPTNAKSATLNGVVVNPQGGGTAFGSAALTNGRQIGWTVSFNADLQTSWQDESDVDKHTAMTWAAGVPLTNGSWMVGGSLDGATRACVAVVGTAPAFGLTMPDAARELVAVVAVSGGHVLVGNTSTNGWTMRFAKSPKDTEPGNTTCDPLP